MFKRFLLSLITISHVSMACADVFKLNDVASNHDALRNAITADSTNLYLNNPSDINIVSFAKVPFNYQKAENLAQSLTQRFIYTDSLNKQINKPFLNNQDIGQLMQSVRNSGLLNYQYTSPAEVDLLKFYATIGQMRMGVFYEQARDLEKEFGGPLDVLRRQGLYDCLKATNRLDNLPQEIIDCSNRKDYFDALFKSEQISGGQLNILDEVFNRMNLRDKDVIYQIKEIVPQWVLYRNGYQLNGPARRIGAVFAQYREGFVERIKQILEGYISEKVISENDLNEFTLPSAQLTEQQVRDLGMLTQDEQEIVISKWGSYWAKVKTMEQYQLSMEYLERALIHPLIKEGFKSVVKANKQFLENEMVSFKEQLGEYRDYADFSRVLFNVTSERKLDLQRQVYGQ